MPVESADDRAAFLDTDEFGTTATFTALAGQPTVDGIFDDAAALAATNIMSSDPQFLCASVDLPDGVADGTKLRINTAAEPTDYYVRTIEADGTGMTVLQLEKVTSA